MAYSSIFTHICLLKLYKIPKLSENFKSFFFVVSIVKNIIFLLIFFALEKCYKTNVSSFLLIKDRIIF